jgi:hypothetical protein
MGVMMAMRLSAADLSQERASLDRESDPARLEASASMIAASNDSAAVADLARHLATGAFLNRLDPAAGRAPGVAHLARVFRAMAANPSPATASLCITVAKAPDFMAVPARLNLALAALAEVRPASEAAAGLFRETGRSGYLEVNGPLLAHNASPRALKVLAELLSDESLDSEQRSSMAHWALLPNRTNPAVVAMSAGLIKGQVSDGVELAIAESLYDEQSRLWFGVDRGPSPPSWQSAPVAAKDGLKSLGARLLARRDLPPQLRAAIQNTLKQLR